MATTEETAESQQDKSLTNGNSSITSLEYSGASEENLNMDQAKIIAQDIVQGFNEDLDAHVAPQPLAKAVKTDQDSHGFSDDEFPKTLTTLETVKKPPPPIEPEEIEICPIEAEDDESEEEDAVLLEVYNEDADDASLDKDSKELHEAPTHSHGTDKKAPMTNQPDEPRKERKQKFTVMSNNDNNLFSLENATNDTSSVTPIKPIPVQSTGTIEIPRELIVASDVDVGTPIIINHIKGQSKKVNSDELIAILEGDDNALTNHGDVEHYELSLPNDKKNGDQSLQLSREEERQIAMNQMLTLPVKKKGRPKMPARIQAKQNVKKTKTNLINQLVSEWGENEAKHDDTTETEILVEIKMPTQRKRKTEMVSPIEPTFRRSRIIKKKIIWDPDAPETAINYASLAHTSGAGPIKKPRGAQNKKLSENTEETEISEVTVAPSAIQKKKKTSEIDKLLGDEGAANMLSSLNQGNNNNEKSDRSSPGKIPRTKAQKTDANIVQSPTTLSAKTKPAKPKDPLKDASPQKQQQNASKKTIAAKTNASGKRRAAAKTSSESWDYIYKSRPDDCMIIRRRSNSSYSSTASLNRNSIDLPSAPPLVDIDMADREMDEPQKKRSRNSKIFEFAKPTPKAKRSGKLENDVKNEHDDLLTKSSPMDFDDSVQTVFTNPKIDSKKVQYEENHIGEVPIKLENGNDAAYAQISLCRFEHFAQITLQPDESVPKSQTFLTLQVCSVAKINLIPSF